MAGNSQLSHAGDTGLAEIAAVDWPDPVEIGVPLTAKAAGGQAR